MTQNNNIITILFFFLCTFCLQSKATSEVLPPDDFLINVGCADLEIGADSCFDVTFGNFEDIISIQFGLRWDFTVLRLNSIENLNTDLNLNALNVVQAGPGQINMVWIDNSTMGIDRPDDEILFTMCFTAIGEVGTFTGFELTGTTPSSGFEFANADGIVLNAVLQDSLFYLLNLVGRKAGIPWEVQVSLFLELMVLSVTPMKNKVTRVEIMGTEF